MWSPGKVPRSRRSPSSINEVGRYLGQQHSSRKPASGGCQQAPDRSVAQPVGPAAPGRVLSWMCSGGSSQPSPAINQACLGGATRWSSACSQPRPG
ncbi:hypothetical protein BKA56DRAFT_582111 [Ilyonectria sp. MPI-CAGE-AT-0026]|nr:hypothetical protein BKA56DRAFT_582111 [Ilyonectria sp. MPI-CAGE-AT-0026]